MTLCTGYLDQAAQKNSFNTNIASVYRKYVHSNLAHTLLNTQSHHKEIISLIHATKMTATPISQGAQEREQFCQRGCRRLDEFLGPQSIRARGR